MAALSDAAAASMGPAAGQPLPLPHPPAIMMSPGAADRVFGYRSGVGGPPTGRLYRVGSGSGSGGSPHAAALPYPAPQPPASLPSPADILRGPMRFGAGVVEQQQQQQQQQQQRGGPIPLVIPSSPPEEGGVGGRKGEALSLSLSLSGTGAGSGQGQSRARRRSSLSASAHRIICGLRLAQDDLGSIALLLVLYTLQGIPMGLSASVPFLLQDRVSYKQQALFSLVSLPFSFKLVWAPVVDSTQFLGLGRRKVREGGREAEEEHSRHGMTPSLSLL